MDLDEYIFQIEEKLKSVTNFLGWSYDELITQGEEMVTCAVNNNHLIHLKSQERHEGKCKWRQDGYSQDDVPLPDSFNNGICVKLTEQLQFEIIKKAALVNPDFKGDSTALRQVPKTALKADFDFTRDERLAIYDYIIQQAGERSSLEDINFQIGKVEKEDNHKLTALEVAAAERNAKRRRASYRNKVHTNKKTHTEIIREVISSQMECLVEHVQEQSKVETQVTEKNNEPDMSKCYDTNSDGSKKNDYDQLSENRDRNHRDRYHERRRDFQNKYLSCDKERKRSPSLDQSCFKKHKSSRSYKPKEMEEESRHNHFHHKSRSSHQSRERGGEEGEVRDDHSHNRPRSSHRSREKESRHDQFHHSSRSISHQSKERGGEEGEVRDDHSHNRPRSSHQSREREKESRHDQSHLRSRSISHQSKERGGEESRHDHFHHKKHKSRSKRKKEKKHKKKRKHPSEDSS